MKTEKLCVRGRNWVQVYNGNGDVRVCGWMNDCYIGNLIDNTLPEVYHSVLAENLRKRLLAQDYSQCKMDACCWLSQGKIKDFQALLGDVPEYPEELRLGFERVCNYNCISCTVCSQPETEEQKKKYDIIEKRIREALPYVKRLGAHGTGELFASKRTLRLLSEWKPLAPIEECSVTLETNGSLFDERHWKQIENLGQYDLKVAITIMSFDEKTYQRLSGVSYPIERIEKNLRFVKSLREQGIINFLELATVVQTENFRTLPEFARRCIEEFGADSVRLRPYENWGAQNAGGAFFMDVRHPEHPWHQEYREVMRHPYLSHPKVNDWSGGLDTDRRELPNEWFEWRWKLLTRLREDMDTVLNVVSKWENLVIYGMGNHAAVLVKAMLERGKDHPLCILDARKPSGSFEGIPVYNLEEAEEIWKKNLTVLVTAIDGVDRIEIGLRRRGMKGKVVPIWELLDDESMKKRLRYLNRMDKGVECNAF